MTGAAATTTALVAIGPAGMIGGLITLGIIGIIANTVSKYGLKKVVAAVVRELYKKGETRQSILTKIENYPITHHPTRLAAVANIFISTPVSTMIAVDRKSNV